MPGIFGSSAASAAERKETPSWPVMLRSVVRIRISPTSAAWHFDYLTHRTSSYRNVTPARNTGRARTDRMQLHEVRRCADVWRSSSSENHPVTHLDAALFQEMLLGVPDHLIGRINPFETCVA